jgi:hypothetical protein
MEDDEKEVRNKKFRDFILVILLVLNIVFVAITCFSFGVLIGAGAAAGKANEKYDLGFEKGEKKARYEMYLDLQKRGVGEYSPVEKSFYFYMDTPGAE